MARHSASLASMGAGAIASTAFLPRLRRRYARDGLVLRGAAVQEHVAKQGGGSTENRQLAIQRQREPRRHQPGPAGGESAQPHAAGE